MSVILVLTHAKDDCASMVIKHFKDRGIKYVRFNTEEFHQKVKFTIDLDTSGNFVGCYHFPDFNLYFEDIGVVWNRRVHQPNIGNELDNNPDLKEWMLDETTWGLNNSFTLIQAPMVNPWENNERLKFNKWIQMKRAAEIGFEIPLSCMTNNLDTIRHFWEETNHEMIFKKIRKGFSIMKDGRRLLVHTSKISETKFNEETLNRMRFCPMFLQQHIPKKYDLRSIVVGEKVFTIAIHSQNVPEGIIDYRTAMVLGKHNEIKHEQIDLGDKVNRKLVAYTKSFGLAFSAIDLILTPDERLVFLEDNPNGQWGWLENITKAPISKAFAEYLIFLMAP